jgi:hypothetical protein
MAIMEKIKITNQQLWNFAQKGLDIDEWLKENIGIGNYTEWIGFVNLPYRSFSFKNESDATYFKLVWG